MSGNKTPMSCWNHYPSLNAILKRPEKYHELKPDPFSTTLARGLGRSYGDAALNEDNTLLLMERMNRMLAFDESNGLLRAESGTTLAEILEVFMPRGWFLPVTPGTKYVTLGGCFAADVHGKNHHVDGSFSRYVREITLILADGSSCRCSRSNNGELFWATAGGMGLTGIISEVTLQLIPIETTSVKVTHQAASGIDQLLSFFQDPQLDDKYTVAWIDCLAAGKALGRGILMRGHHAARSDIDDKNPLQRAATKGISVPCFLPPKTLNYWSVKAFNALYYYTQSRKQSFICGVDRFFYPLDNINNWNRIYGHRGFLQYQCVVPLENADKAMPALLTTLSKSRRGSFLGVIKRFGKEGEGFLSFPQEGITLALDIPLTDDTVFALLNQLDEIVLSNGGRVYLAKDARLSRDKFEKMYPRYSQWLQIKNSVDPHHRFSSTLGRRLML